MINPIFDFPMNYAPGLSILMIKFINTCPFFATIHLCRMWELEQASNLDTPSFIELVRGIVHGHPMDLNNSKDLSSWCYYLASLHK
jgi:hypothetical protein